MRSHKAKRKSSKLINFVDRRRHQGRVMREQGKMTLGESMVISGRGYGSLDQLEADLEKLNVK